VPGYIFDLIETMACTREIVILKARQLFISWLMCAYAVWSAVFHDYAKVLLLSYKEEGGSWELIDKCLFIYNALPDFIKRELDSDTRSQIGFKHGNSRIKALPSTETAGTGYTATLVIRDELEKHPYAEKNFAAIGPTVDAGGQMIDLSTIEKSAPDSHFRKRYISAKTGSNTQAVFLGWRLRPVRQEGLSLDDWFKQNIEKKYTKLQIEQEYPETEDQALSPPETTAFFDRAALNDMEWDVIRVLETRHSEQVKIYVPPIIGRKYVAFLDPSDGSEDPHAGIIMDFQTDEVVAETHGFCKADQCAKQFDELVREYNQAFNDFESNASVGGKVSEVLAALGTPNRRVNRYVKGEPMYGWYTGGNSANSTRRDMIWELEEAVRKRKVRVHNKDIITELKSFIQPPGEAPCPMGGAHDDYIMALGGCLLIAKEMPSQTLYKPGKLRGY